MKLLLSFLATLFFCSNGVGGQQLSALSTTVGDASSDSPNNGCFELTPDMSDKTGAVWSDSVISVDNPFVMESKIYAGRSNSGADGMAFVLQNGGTSTIGSGGGSGQGYDGIPNAFVIEVDTYPSDSSENGGDFLQVQHSNSGGSFTSLGSKNWISNIEDNMEHCFIVYYDGDYIIVYLDGSEIVNLQVGTLSTYIGNNEAYYGYTAATGGLSNQQYVCPISAQYSSVAPPSQCSTPSPTQSPSLRPSSSPTPSPTQSPTLSEIQYKDLFEIGYVGSANCFSSQTTTNVQGKGTTNMEDIQVGDKVLTSSGEYATIYSIDHRHPTKVASFIQIHVEEQQHPLELTPKHMLFMEGYPNPVPASTIKVGDQVQTLNGPVSVTKINTITRAGVFSPLTVDGTIVASGIVASSYSAYLSDNEWIEIAGMKVMAHQTFYNMALKPYKYICTGLSLEFCKTSNEKVAVSHFATKIYFHSRKYSEWCQNVMLSLVVLIVSMTDLFFSLYFIILTLLTIGTFNKMTQHSNNSNSVSELFGDNKKV